MKVYFKVFRNLEAVTSWLNHHDEVIKEIISITHSEFYSSEYFYVFYKSEHELI